MRNNDSGYASFLAMSLMLHSFQECLKENKLKEYPGFAAAEKLSQKRLVEGVRRWRRRAAESKARREHAATSVRRLQSTGASDHAQDGFAHV